MSETKIIVFCITVILTVLNFVQASDECLNYYNQAGVCIPIRSCPSLYRLDSYPHKSFFDRAIIDGSYCKGVNKDKVCCADGVIERPSPTTDRYTESTIRPNTERTNSNSGLFPVPGSGDCGVQVIDKIVGGTDTAINEFPWMALLEYTWSNGAKDFRCGGSLINERYVLTAAHCVRTNPRLSGVRLGEWNYNTASDCQTRGITTVCSDPPQDFEIERKIIHSRYRSVVGSKDDIALLRLSKPAKISLYVRPICLPSSENLRQIPDYQGTQFIVAGWGLTENNVASPVKLKVEVDGVSIADCKASFNVWDNQVCAGAKPGKDSCGGDSGGPLMATHSDEPGKNYWYLAGAVSFGATHCGTAGVPGVYTRIDRYLDWIENNVEA